MSVAFYDLVYQNGFRCNASIVLDETLYRKIEQDASGSFTTVVSGTLADVRNYMGYDFFNQEIHGYRNTPMSDAGRTFFSAFKHAYYDIVESTNHYYSVDTHGVAQMFGTYGGNQFFNYCVAGDSIANEAPFSYEMPFGASYIMHSYNVLSPVLWLDSKKITLITKYDEDTNTWSVQAQISSTTWNTYLHSTQAGISVYNYLNGTEPFYDDPYKPGGYSEPGEGTSNFSEESDAVSENNMPDESEYGATACGLVTVFSPTKPQLKKLADVILGNGFWNFVQNMVENISDLFISLAMVPFTVDKGSTVEVTWWGYTGGGLEPGTGVYLTLAAKTWYEFDMGSIALDGSDSRIFAAGSVLDYSPYSKLGIYLPFIGYQELDIDECRDNVLKLIYRIDIVSGTVVALIHLISEGKDRTIYQFTGNCATQIPLTSVDAQSMFTNAVNIAISMASAGATGAVASAGDAYTQERLSAGKLSQSGANMQNAQHAAMVSNAEGSLASSTANGIMGMKPNYKKTGAIASSAALFAVMQPYLFLTTPRQSYPENYGHYCGFPCNITGVLGSFSGYTVVEDIRLNGLVATSSEVEEIYNLLKTGVII